MSVPPSADTVTVYRIATEAPAYGANDLRGIGSQTTGGRWNPVGVPVVYASTTRALACLETVVHLEYRSPLPLNRFLVEITVPRHAWDERTVFDPAAIGGWDAEPAGIASIGWGARWLSDGTTLLADVPSILVPEERNVLLNPAHPDMVAVTARTMRRWRYDDRLRPLG